MTLTLQIILVLASILMSVFVLLHRGKGGGLSSLFGGVQANLSGSTVVEKNLNRYTVIVAVIWILCIIGLNLIQAYGL